MKYCYINEDNFQYFKPLLQPEQQKRMMSDPSIFGLGCYDKDTACGIVIYTINEERMILRIIYVAVSLSYQKQGVATGMIKSLSRNAYEEGYIILANFFAKDKDDPRYAMFDNTDEFSIDQVPGGVYVVNYDKVKDVVYNIPPAEYDKKTHGTRSQVSKCTSHAKQLIYDLIKTSGVEPSEIKPYIDEDLSYVVIGQDDVPTAMVIISHYDKQNQYEITFATSTVPEHIADLHNILLFTVTDIFDRMEPQDTLRFSTSVESVDRLAEKYFSKDFKYESFYIAGYNGDSVI